MNSYGGVEEYLYAFLLLVLDGDVQSAVWPGRFKRGAIDPGGAREEAGWSQQSV